MSVVAGWQLDLGAAVGSKIEVPRTKYCRTFLLCNILAMSWVTPCMMMQESLGAFCKNPIIQCPSFPFCTYRPYLSLSPSQSLSLLSLYIVYTHYICPCIFEDRITCAWSHCASNSVYSRYAGGVNDKSRGKTPKPILDHNYFPIFSTYKRHELGYIQLSDTPTFCFS